MSDWPIHARCGTAAGLTTGMLVETDRGWQSAETIAAGDMLYTMDGATRTVRSVAKQNYPATPSGSFPDGLILVPGGALGNCEACYLFPDTHVLLTGTAIEALTGDGAALASAADLVGYSGIVRALPVDGIDAIGLYFDDEEVLLANSGLPVHCRAHGRGQAVSDVFGVLSPDQARVLLSCQSLAGGASEAEEAQGGPAPHRTRGKRAVA